MNKNIITLIGFILFLSGMYALSLSLVGAKFTPLLFLEKLGGTASFFIKILMVLVGVLLIFLSRTNTEMPNE
ncbi:MAG: hypothetical protein P8M17_04235 [Saprospiraceae bacterium]|jgi:hypothetical protein|nr:hypothetical protein [Saprospiraceae bacterium]MDB4539227.1 hypothetical protein [Saprospiraceae bacterium]MDC3220080.1 hypothetical protein [Saprospiraceae bacterium]MDG1436004.1 hypothetical protein [Saprospiraceae bacterium]MDG2418180.1 hypothetical protein [Saprospiraceae bacterium]